MMMSQRLAYTVLFFVLVITLIIVSKPRILFDENKNIITFGTGDNKTIFPLGVVVVLLAFISFYFFSIIDIVFEKK